MVIGFFIALVLLVPLAGLIMAGFELNSMATTSGFSFIFGTIAYLVMLSILMIRFAHKIFGLVTVIPDTLLRWIGGSSHSLGETNDEQGINSAVVGVFNRVGGAATGTSGQKMAGQNRGRGKEGDQAQKSMEADLAQGGTTAPEPPEPKK